MFKPAAFTSPRSNAKTFATGYAVACDVAMFMELERPTKEVIVMQISPLEIGIVAVETDDIFAILEEELAEEPVIVRTIAEWMAL